MNTFIEDKINVDFCFLSDTPSGKDPDQYSPTLRRYHKQLWGRALPNGKVFKLNDNVSGAYLHHSSSLGEFRLSSDSIVPTYSQYKRQGLSELLAQIPKQDVEQFRRLVYTIGGMIIFPSNRVDRRPTINGYRGMSAKIGDRFDLTLECICRYYSGVSSPLTQTLERYEDFFKLFVDFAGYIEFFLLQDLTDQNDQVRFFLPFDDFESSAFPSSKIQYERYMDASIKFLRSRNSRIADLMR